VKAVLIIRTVPKDNGVDVNVCDAVLSGWSGLSAGAHLVSIKLEVKTASG